MGHRRHTNARKALTQQMIKKPTSTARPGRKIALTALEKLGMPGRKDRRQLAIFSPERASKVAKSPETTQKIWLGSPPQVP